MRTQSCEECEGRFGVSGSPLLKSGTACLDNDFKVRYVENAIEDKSRTPLE